jgi:hypothetical protein
VQGWSHMAAPVFGAEGTDGRASAAKIQVDQEHGAPVGNIAPGASNGAGEAPGEVRRVRGRVATSVTKGRRS